MGLYLFLLSIFFICSCIIFIVMLIVEDDTDTVLFSFVAGAVFMAGIWCVWVIYKFFMLPLGL